MSTPVGVISPDVDSSDGMIVHFSTAAARQLVRAPYKKDLPCVGGFEARRFRCGRFQWLHWGLADADGRFLTQASLRAWQDDTQRTLPIGTAEEVAA